MPGKRKKRINLLALRIIVYSSSKYGRFQWELIKHCLVKIFWLNVFPIIQIFLKKIILICTMKCSDRFWRSHVQKAKDFTQPAKLKQLGFLQISVLWLFFSSMPQPAHYVICLEWLRRHHSGANWLIPDCSQQQNSAFLLQPALIWGILRTL